LASSDGITGDDVVELPAGTHAHYNWGFTAPGTYRVTMEASGVLVDGGETAASQAVVTFVVGDATIAAPDDYMVTGDNMVRGNVFLNDQFADGAVPMISPGDAPGHGSVAWNPDGSFTYTPDGTFDGEDRFSYILSDGTTDTIGVVTVTAATPPQGEVLNEGHADFAVNYHDDHWDFAVFGEHEHGHDHGHDHGDDHGHDHDHGHDDDHGHGGGLHLDEVIIHGGADAGITRPEGAAFDFTGVSAGETLYVLPQANTPGLPFIGLNGEEIEANTFVDNEFSLNLLAVDGPGEFSLWQSDSFGTPEIFFASSDGITAADSITLPEGAHAHHNWGFSEEGTYRVTVQASGVLQDGMTPVVSEAVTLTFMIGDVLVASPDRYTVSRGNSIHGNVLFNDFAPDAESLVAELGATVSRGSLDFASDGSFVYTPSSDFHQAESFVYSVRDGSGAELMATVMIDAAMEHSFDVVFSNGHADIGLALGEHDHGDGGGDHDHADPEWDLHIHDEDGDAEYDPDDGLFYVGMSAYTQRTAAAASPEFDFMGVAPGEFFYLLPAAESPNLLHVGFSTEEIESGTLLDGTATLHLKSVDGPGEFSLWDSGLAGVDVKFATSDGISSHDELIIPEGVHRHYNMGFSKAGRYEITVQASGTLADGDTVVSEDVTYFFQVGNTVSEIDVATGQQQRSFVRDLDLVFLGEESLDEIADLSRIRLTQYDVAGENGFDILDPARFPNMSVDGNVLSLDWGSQGIGGNRSTTLGNGLYRLSVDIDGDGEYDVDKYFHRLFGDVDGDGSVDQADLDQIIASIGTNDPESDVDGNRRVNAIDRILASRSLGQHLADGIHLDD
jgi:surface-anchored protein